MKKRYLVISLSLLFTLVLSACTAPIFGSEPTLVHDTLEPVGPTSAPAIEATSTNAIEPTETSIPTESSVATPSGWVAFTGYDGNIWLVEQANGETMQVTTDAVPYMPAENTQIITYFYLQWSSDGNLLAYVRETGTPVSWGMQVQTDMWVYDLTTKTARQLLADTRAIGFSWKPNTHMLAYALPVDDGYFISRETLATELAKGIWAVDADSGESFELVKPERGYSLVNPIWSPDGRFITFDEVLQMEGRGQKANYDFENQIYTPWEETIGSFSWSPDGAYLVFDQIGYTAQSGERVWIKDIRQSSEQPLSPDYTPGYAMHPVFSPAGDQVAYLANLSGDEMGQITLFIIPSTGGDPRSLGTFTQFWEVHWTSDGNFLVLSAGPYDQQQVMMVSAADGSIRVLADGSNAIPQP